MSVRIQSLVVAALALLAACGPPPVTESRSTTYADGTVWSEVELLEGQPHGSWNTYWPDGSPRSVETWNRGVLDGPFGSWFEDGTERIQGLYQDGRMQGRWVVRFPDGSMRSEDHWQNGQRHGVLRMWHANGQLFTEDHYALGKLDGSHRIYFEDGSVREAGELKAGERDGLWREFREDGTPVHALRFVDGRRRGTCYTWGPNGELNLDKSGVFREGRRLRGLRPAEIASAGQNL